MNDNDEILYMAQNGEPPYVDYPVSKADWDKYSLIPAQLWRYPLFDKAEADISATIGKRALVPLSLSMPVIVSHMSIGALCSELKLSIARAAARAGIALGSGDGGVLQEEMELSSAYIYEYTPGLFSLSPETLERCSAVEIKLGQGCGGGLGFDVPSGAEPIAYTLRRGESGAFLSTDGRFSDIVSHADLKLMIDGLREGALYKPVGVKIAAGHIERDLDIIIDAGADFVTIDGGYGGWRGQRGFMGAMPPSEALIRAKKQAQKRGSDIDIIIAGGIHTAADAAKALALGAAAVAPASAVLTAGCGCVTGKSPYSADETERRVLNYLRAMSSGLRTACAYTGRARIEELDESDVVKNF